MFKAANFFGSNWTFGYLSALAEFVGVIAVGGPLLSWRRAATPGRPATSWAAGSASPVVPSGSPVVEPLGVAVAGLVIGALLAAEAVPVVYRRLDVELVRPPTPLLDVPWLDALLTAVVTTLMAVATAGYAQRAAHRTNPDTVLREDA